MKRVTASAQLPTPWFFEPAKRPDDRAEYCLDLRIREQFYTTTPAREMLCPYFQSVSSSSADGYSRCIYRLIICAERATEKNSAHRLQPTALPSPGSGRLYRLVPR